MRSIQFYLLFLLSGVSTLSYATSYEVGPARNYTSPNALYLANVIADGDTIFIDAGEYHGNATLANWNRNNLLIRGTGGYAHLIADGAYFQGKGIWIISGNNVTVENIEFSGATVPDMNGAGIRFENLDLTVSHCYFHDNEEGILGGNPGAGVILIEYCEFAHNGFGDGYSHNLYIGHSAKLIFQYNYTHHAVVGHNLKSRANENYILFNRIMDEETGNSSRLIDLPNGGFCLIMGNLLMQGENAENNNMLGYGQEGLNNPGPNTCYIINNTFINKRSTCVFIDTDGKLDGLVANNIFGGNGTIYSGSFLNFEDNLVETNIPDLLLVDEGNYDYHLTAKSPAVDYGMAVKEQNGLSLTPEYEYVHVAQGTPRTLSGSAIDAGAYEFEQSSSTYPLIVRKFSVWPNPVKDELFFNLETDEQTIISIYDIQGRKIFQQNTSQSPVTTLFDPGLYFMVAETKSGTHYYSSFIKI